MECRIYDRHSAPGYTDTAVTICVMFLFCVGSSCFERQLTLSPRSILSHVHSLLLPLYDLILAPCLSCSSSPLSVDPTNALPLCLFFLQTYPVIRSESILSFTSLQLASSLLLETNISLDSCAKPNHAFSYPSRKSSRLRHNLTLRWNLDFIQSILSNLLPYVYIIILRSIHSLLSSFVLPFV